MSNGDVKEKVLGVAHWVGAIKRDTEGSYMQLQSQLCRWNQAAIWSRLGCFGKSEDPIPTSGLTNGHSKAQVQLVFGVVPLIGHIFGEVFDQEPTEPTFGHIA